MLGKAINYQPAFPYTFPIDFTLIETAQLFDDTEETFEFEVHTYIEYDAHEDMHLMWSTPIFPADGEAPTTASTQTVIQEGTASSKAVLTGSPVSKVVISG
tara:strand:+ start:261 stop:563 length:303 start_codon:yes stop_codon:yes gene_type:complete